MHKIGGICLNLNKCDAALASKPLWLVTFVFKLFRYKANWTESTKWYV